jgi:hypothetical protein
MPARQTDSATTRLEAECLRCGWRTTAANGMGNAARHHDATGHPVRINVDRVITYGDANAPMSGQTSLLDDQENTAP